MTDVATRPYRGKSAAERTAARRAALVRAAFELAAAEGWSQLRIERICRAAGLNKRYFYESFADLDAVIAAIMEELAGEVIEVTIAAMDLKLPRPDVIRAGISALVHHLTDDPRRAHVLLGEASGSDAAARHREQAIHRVVAAAVAQGRAIEILDPSPEPVVDLAGTLLIGGTRQAVLDYLDGRLHGDLGQFIDDLAALWQAVGEAATARLQA